MKKGIISALALLFIAGLTFQSCEKASEGGNEKKISEYSDDESHNAGENCMTCHVENGEGEGWFTVAGTVYDESKSTVYPDATVKFYTEANAKGELVYTSEVDGKGNFYTTESIDFGSGLYVSVTGSTGTKHMITALTTGACNSCHSTSDNRIWAQ